MKLKSLVIGLFFATLSVGYVPASQAAKAMLINGAGATFPYPLYSKWFSLYSKINSKVKINYQSIGSGGGIRQLLDKTVDFGATDAPMKDKELAKSKVHIIHLPTVLGAVAITYNVPGVRDGMKLTGKALAAIYLGKITKWNDPKLVALNNGLNLPNKYITVAHRSDGSGTSAVFTDYLSKVNPDWKTTVGQGKSIQWPVGLGGKGNEGVTGLVKQNPNSIGYIELAYAKTNHLPVVALKNRHGDYVLPSVKAVSKAAAGAKLPKDFRASITDAAGKGSYPISAFTYLIVYEKLPAAKGHQLVSFLDWAYSKGQSMAEPMDYAPLPKSLIKKVKRAVRQIKFVR